MISLRRILKIRCIKIISNANQMKFLQRDQAYHETPRPNKLPVRLILHHWKCLCSWSELLMDVQQLNLNQTCNSRALFTESPSQPFNERMTSFLASSKPYTQLQLHAPCQPRCTLSITAQPERHCPTPITRRSSACTRARRSAFASALVVCTCLCIRRLLTTLDSF